MAKNNHGSSLVEVMVMMVIMSISIIGIYTLVNSGQRLAQSTEERRIALGIAREGIESILSLRDSFSLRKYTANSTTPLPCFFSIDGSNYGACPDTSKKYILTGSPKILEEKTSLFPVCINTNGWYEQGSTCPGTYPVCSSPSATGCQTRYERFIKFSDCVAPAKGLDECVQATVTVRWGTTPDKEVTLTHTLTKY